MARVRGSCRIAPPSRSTVHAPASRRNQTAPGPVPTTQQSPIDPAQPAQPTQDFPSADLSRDDITTPTSRGLPNRNVLNGTPRTPSHHETLIVGAEDLPGSEDVTTQGFDAFWRSVAPGAEWPPDLSVKLASTQRDPSFRQYIPQSGTEDAATQHYLEGALAIDNLEPALYEANEQRRAKKYEYDSHGEAQAKRNTMATSVRHNKLPSLWNDPWTHNTGRKKKAVAGPKRGTFGPAAPRPHELGSASPVYAINDSKNLEEPPSISLDSSISRPIPQLTRGVATYIQDRTTRMIPEYDFLPSLPTWHQERCIEDRTRTQTMLEDQPLPSSVLDQDPSMENRTATQMVRKDQLLPSFFIRDQERGIENQTTTQMFEDELLPSLSIPDQDPGMGNRTTTEMILEDQFLPNVSIRDQERGVDNRAPDPFLEAPSVFCAKRHVEQTKRQGVGLPPIRLGVPRFIMRRQHSWESIAAERAAMAESLPHINRYFNIDAVCQSQPRSLRDL
ncbi:hypothetical protein K458DRAFT_460904 [Lentithecium fluviatile CBS 122367]|uniref:Uncharacterized protein n=1 Tax=Lentithecium fluviatile CBS 122367 TaxID=1168545 RepID=A0A6G1IME0_9PLEO|nr:hypothetical protein K458DRAFT_460904 [Lentithecium fluviatile CBS 122367]